MKNRATYTLAALFLMIFVDSLAFGLIIPVLTPLVLDPARDFLPLGTSLAVRNMIYGGMLSVLSISVIISSPLIGYLSDFIGRKKLLIASLVGVAFGYLLAGVAIHFDSISLLFVSQAIDGLSVGGFALAESAIMDVSEPEKKTSNISTVYLASVLGIFIGPLFSGFFSTSTSFFQGTPSTPFWIAFWLAIVNACLLAVTFKETYQPEEKGKGPSFSLRGYVADFFAAFKSEKMRFLCICIFVSQFADVLYTEFLFMYLVQKLHYGSQQIGVFMAYMAVIAFIVFAFIIRLVTKFAKTKTIIFFCFIVSGIFIIRLGFSQGESAVWYYVVPINIALLLSEPVLTTVISNSVTKKRQGWAMGVFNSLIEFAALLACLCVGLLGYISLLFPFLVSGILLFLSATGFWFCFRKYPKLGNAPVEEEK